MSYDDTVREEIRQALFEMQQYFSDRVAPMMVADSIELLVKQPPELAAAQIQGWAAAQYRGTQEGLSLIDYYFHALKKLHLMGALQLLPKATLRKYLEDLEKLMIARAPEEDREVLKSNLAGLGRPEADLVSPPQVLHPQGAGSSPLRAGGAFSEEAARGLKRFSLLIERLQSSMKGAAGHGTGAAAGGGGLMSQIVATAALSSRTPGDLDQFLARLREAGVEAGTDRIFKELGRSLPGWALPASAVADGGAPSSGPALEAMQRLITLTNDRAEGAKRFREMVLAAIEQFNQGAIGPAVTMFDLADRLVAEKKVDPQVIESIRNRAHESLNVDEMRKLTERPDRHPLLRKVLTFFPALRPNGLLDDLNGEQKRERRHFLLILLEAHGPAARAAALKRLEGAAPGDVGQAWYYTRNLLHLLRRIPRPQDAPVENEMDLVARFSSRDQPLPVTREAIGVLGQTKHRKSERALIVRLAEYEATLLSERHPPEDPQETRTILDQILSALARFGTPTACRAVLDHALGGNPQLGDTMARLADLGEQDLSGDREAVDRLLESLRSQMPRKIFGFAFKKRHENLLHLIEALSGTPASAVRQVFAEIVQGFPGEQVAEAAGAALAGFDPARRPPETGSASLSGDLDLFGLPNLMQNLADSKVTGVLTLTGAEGRIIGTLNLHAGKIQSCQMGHLQGEDAVFQLFEKPVPATFALRRASEPQTGGNAPEVVGEVTALLLEGMRRYDEFRQACAIVPDDMRLASTGRKPTPLEDENDQVLIRTLWSKAFSGATPSRCEEEIAADSYRIRRLLAHWLEGGALQPAAGEQVKA